MLPESNTWKFNGACAPTFQKMMGFENGEQQSYFNILSW